MKLPQTSISIVKGIAIILIAFYIISNIYEGINGISTIDLTVAMYLFAGCCSIIIINLLIKKKTLNTNLKLLCIVFLASAFSAELLLRYVLKLNLMYLEKNGSPYYVSLYQPRFKIIEDENSKPEDILFCTYRKNSTGLESKPEFRYRHKYNSLGLRGYEPAKDSAKYTIIGLGDSFTEGVGATADSTWPCLLEAKLDNLHLLSKDVQMINGGGSGSDPVEELMLLKMKLLDYKPGMVIVCINLSDVGEIIIRGGKERFHNNSMSYKKAPWQEFFYSFSFIYRGIYNAAARNNFIFMSNGQYDKEKAIATEKIKTLIKEDFKSLAREYGFKLVVVLHPIQSQLERNERPLAGLSQAFKQDTSMITVDLFEEFTTINRQNHIPYNKLFWQYDTHNNGDGYNQWAQVITDKIFTDKIIH